MTLTLILAFIAAILVGLSKAGLKGLGLVVVALMANAYGAKASTGILVPLFLIGDILSVVYYKKHVKWKYLYRFLPAMVIGVLVAVFVGKNLDEDAFKYWMAVIIILSVLILFYRDYKKKVTFPKNPIFAYSMGITAGFTTMLGNLAGAFTNIFFLATRLPKNEIIGTTAWLYLLINVFKMPFHIFSWKTIHMESIYIDLMLAPIVIVGFLIGLKIVKYFTEDLYRKFLLVATILGAIFIII